MPYIIPIRFMSINKMITRVTISDTLRKVLIGTKMSLKVMEKIYKRYEISSFEKKLSSFYFVSVDNLIKVC